MSPLANHLWQSTVFAIIAWLCALALRRNRAAVRYWLWFAASVKFLVPFSLLVGIGRQVEWRSAAAVIQPQFSDVIAEISQPFSRPAAVTPLPDVPRHADSLPLILLGLWFCGFVPGLIFWLRSLRQIHEIRRTATPLPLDLPVPVLSSPAHLEPGVFGIRKPVLVLPQGIADRLAATQLQSVLAHELCHVRRRDNLTAAIHMAVEVIFWFHPLIWWIRTRLIAERERACDEEVVRTLPDPQVYAEGILSVCKFYLESPRCASGVTGADLKKRITEIMSGQVGCRLVFGKKLLLATLGAGAIAVPLAIGLLHAPPSRAQSPSPNSLFFEVASVKQVTGLPLPDGFSTAPRRSGRRISWVTSPAKLVEYAYNVQQWRVSGTIPRGIFYEVDATTNSSTTPDQLRRMFQTLLVERFHLAVRRQTREVSGFALTVGKKGPRLVSPANGEPAPLPAWFKIKGDEFARLMEGRCIITKEGPMNALTGRRVSMAQLAEVLQDEVQTFVHDRTGLAGDYYFGILFARDGDPRRQDDPIAGPDLFAALQEQLGLKLEKQNGRVENLIVDHMDRLPTAN